MLARKGAADGEETARGVVFRHRAFRNIWHQLYVAHSEESRIVEQRTVHPALVGTLDMSETESSFGERFLRHEVGEHLGVLHLAHSDGGASHPWQHVGAHVGKHTCHVAQLVGVFQTVPVIRSRRQELVVVLPHIMTCVEQVFLIVEPHGVSRVFLLCRYPGTDREQQQHQNQITEFSHIFIYNIYFAFLHYIFHFHTNPNRLGGIPRRQQ